MAPKTSGPLAVIGSSGLKQYSGYVVEEFLRELQGPKWRMAIKEMSDQDAIVGAVKFAIEMLLRKVTWGFQPGDDSPEAAEEADWFDGALHDMEANWEDQLAEILGFLDYGWSYHETNYKIRGGASDDPLRNSKFDDGRIGWRSFAGRSQDSLWKWEFDPEDQNKLLGMWQIAPPYFNPVMIPLTKALLFRTTVKKGNPEGKALDPATPVITPDGWRTMDDLQPGDKVFDEQGRIRYITARKDWIDRPCWELTFTGGTKVIADAAHEWLTQDAHDRSLGRFSRVRTTAEIAADLKTKNGTANHSIPWGGALDFPEQALPVDPYYLGLWLGDGWSRTADLSCHADDAEEEAAMVGAAGYVARIEPNGTPGGKGRVIRVQGQQRWTPHGPRQALRGLGLLENKHVPAAYLRSSVAQRRALLAGLMDSDGHIDAWGRCEFVNTNRVLVDGVAALVRSLGCGVTVGLRRKAGIGRATAWAVRFTPDVSPFRLARKSARVKLARARKNHYILSAEPVAPRRTVCIEVDGPSHLFLAGEAMVPTHNSILRNAYRSWYFKKHIENIEGVGIERDLAGLPIAYVPPELMDPNASPDKKLLYTAVKDIVQNIRRDQQEGIVMPMVYDDNGNKMYDLQLLTTGGSRQFDTSAIINRYDQRIAMTALADFILIGHESVGSFALTSSKQSMFVAACEAWLDMVADVINTDAVPRLRKMNGFTAPVRPQLKHGQINDVDLVAMGNFLNALSSAGAPLFPNPDLLKHLLESANLPVPSEEAA